MRMKRELAQSENEIARLHSVFEERVETLTKVGNERVVKHSQQIGVLRAEILRLQSRSENKGDAEAEKEKIPDNPKREVSVAPIEQLSQSTHCPQIPHAGRRLGKP